MPGDSGIAADVKVILAQGLSWISLLVLVGVLLSLRFVVLPSLQSLPADDGVMFMGRLMIKARRLFLAVGLVCAVSSLSWAADGQLLRPVLIGLFLVIIAILGMPPGTSWFPRLLPRRRLLLNAGILIGLVIIASEMWSWFLTVH